LFATQNRDFLLEKKSTTHQQNHFLFLVFGDKVNVHFNFRSHQTQAGMQVSSAILLVSLFSYVIIEQALSKITNTEHIFNAKSLNRELLPGSIPLVAGVVTLQSFQNASLEFS